LIVDLKLCNRTERLIPLSVKLFTNELDVEGKCLTPYLEQGSDAFQLSGNQSKFCKEGVLMFYLGIDIGKRTHVASVMNDEGKVLLKGFSFANSLDGTHALLERLTSFSDSTDDFLIGDVLILQIFSLLI